MLRRLVRPCCSSLYNVTHVMGSVKNIIPRCFSTHPIKNGFIMMYKYRGESTEHFQELLQEKLGLDAIYTVEDLDPDFCGLVSFSVGRSQKFLNYLYDSNVYRLSLSFVDEESRKPISIERKDFASVISRFIGETRQKQCLPIDDDDDDDEDSKITRSYTINISDIAIKKFNPGPQAQTDVILRCKQGCDVEMLIYDIEKQLKVESKTNVAILPINVERSEHCGLPEHSPMCIDSEDIHYLEYVHTYVPPWFMLNEITMLRHLSVAYFEKHKLYELFHKDGSLPASDGIQYYEHWTNDEPIPMKPVENLPVLLVCAPRKVLKEVDLRGKRRMLTIPTSFCGIGRIVKLNTENTSESKEALPKSDGCKVNYIQSNT